MSILYELQLLTVRVCSENFAAQHFDVFQCQIRKDLQYV